MSKKQVEQYFLWFCRYVLLVTYFKRYWPVRGSYWNTRHLNKKSVDQLKQVVNEANEFTRQHVQQTMLLIIVYGVIALTAPSMPQYQHACFLVYFITNGYAFAVHHYNRILAQRSIQNILSAQKKNVQSDLDKEDDDADDAEEEEEYDEKADDNKTDHKSEYNNHRPCLTILRTYISNKTSPKYWSLVFKPGYIDLSPKVVADRSSLVEYRAHLRTLPQFQSSTDLSRSLFCKEVDPAQLYSHFLSSYKKGLPDG